MGSGSQPFERLIRLEDDELDTNNEEEDHHGPDKDSCKVAILPNGNRFDNLETIFHETKHKTNKSGNNIGSGFHFNFNGRHIRMNTEQLKYISLITLTVQNAALTLTMRAANTQKEKFSSAVAVTIAEILKLITCLALLCYEEVTIDGAIKAVKVNIINNYLDTLKVAVPSFVYYIQNNLLYIGSTHLDAATTQVTYQLKILTTAVFSVVMLNKKLSKLQWAALVILFVGVALIETMITGPDSKATSTSLNRTGFIPEKQTEIRDERPMLGFMAILIACCLSGFAGVYFEKILKNTSHVSLWIRNIQLSAATIPIGLIQVFILEYEYATTEGIFYGFTPLTWFCIMLQVQGGLLVAIVVKFANNILKGFATSLAIVISTVASMFLFGFNLTPTFIIGASLVIGSVMMYNKQ